jgi:hypothetical protein
MAGIHSKSLVILGRDVLMSVHGLLHSSNSCFSYQGRRRFTVARKHFFRYPQLCSTSLDPEARIQCDVRKFVVCIAASHDERFHHFDSLGSVVVCWILIESEVASRWPTSGKLGYLSRILQLTDR